MAGNLVQNQDFQEVMDRLKAIRDKHLTLPNLTSTQTTNLNNMTFPTPGVGNIAQPSAVSNVKNAASTLETNSPALSGFSSGITIPNVGDLLREVDWSSISAMESACVNCAHNSSNYSSNYSSNFSSNFSSNHSNNSSNYSSNFSSNFSSNHSNNSSNYSSNFSSNFGSNFGSNHGDYARNSSNFSSNNSNRSSNYSTVTMSKCSRIKYGLEVTYD